jgi:hypothetical protein
MKYARGLIILGFALLLPLVASAQVTTTYQPGTTGINTSGPGLTIFVWPPPDTYGVGGGWEMIQQLLADDQAHGENFLHDLFGPDNYNVTSSGLATDKLTGFVYDTWDGFPTLDQACLDLDTDYGAHPSAIYNPAYPPAHWEPSDDSDNYNLQYCASGDCENSRPFPNPPHWLFEASDGSRPAPSGTAGYVASLTCTSYSLPSQTLTLSKTSIPSGGSATLSWTDTAYRDTYWPVDPNEPSSAIYEGGGVDSPAGPYTQCTATSNNPASLFSIPTTTDESAYVCDGKWTYVPGNCGDPTALAKGGKLAASALLAVSACNDPGSWACLRNPLVPISAMELDNIPNTGSGSITVSPTQPTTYTYSCTNANGTTIETATLNVTGGATGPNLVSTLTSPADSAAVPAGTPVTLSGQVSNNGTASTNASFYNIFEVYPSMPTSNLTFAGITSGGGSVIPESPPDPAPALAPQGSENISAQNTFPTPANGSATWYIRTCANANTSNASSTAFTESNYNDNCSYDTNDAAGLGWTPVTVGTNAADLIAGQITPNVAQAGVQTTFTATITNQGLASTGSGFPNLFQITTSPIDNNGNATGSVTNVGTASVASALGSQQSTPVSLQYTPPAVPTYYMRVCANTTDNVNFDVPESNTANNCGIWTSIQTYVPLQVSCSVASSGTGAIPPASGTTASTYTWTADASGGTGNYTYIWDDPSDTTGSDPLDDQTANPAVIQPPNGYYCASGTCSFPGSVTVYDDSGESVTEPCGSAGPGTASVVPTPTITSFTVSSPVVCGSTSSLNWTATDATSCSVSGDPDSPYAYPDIDSTTETPLTSPTTPYTLTCYDAAGTPSAPYTQNVTVTSPQVAIWAAAVRVRQGASDVINWTASNVVPGSCTIEANGAPVPGETGPSANTPCSPGPNGTCWDSSYTATNVSRQTVYTITCDETAFGGECGGPTFSTNTTVNVNPSFFNF